MYFGSGCRSGVILRLWLNRGCGSGPGLWLRFADNRGSSLRLRFDGGAGFHLRLRSRGAPGSRRSILYGNHLTGTGL